jgi:AcrR family transcriptional regulator
MRHDIDVWVLLGSRMVCPLDFYTVAYKPTLARTYTATYKCDRRHSMALARTPRRCWIDAGLHALAAGGPDAVRIETLAQTLGVTKGGFYGYFADRGALLDEMLDVWEHEVVDDVIEVVEGPGGDARTKLRRLFEIAGSGDGLADDVVMLRAVDLAVRDWSRRDRAVAARLRRADNRRMDYMRALFGEFCADDDVEVRCMLAFSIWVANEFIAADHGNRSRADVLRLMTQRLLA